MLHFRFIQANWGFKICPDSYSIVPQDIKNETNYCPKTLPVDMQPFVVSPKAWIWKPWRPGLRPERFPVTVVGPAQFAIHVNRFGLAHIRVKQKLTLRGDQRLLKLTISLLREANSTRDIITVTKNCHSLHHCSMWSEEQNS